MSKPDSKIEYLRTNYRRPSPADHARLRRLAVERAKALRVDFLQTLWRSVACWYQARAAVAQLRALDDTALKDIGLHRSGIEAAVRGGSTKSEAPQPRPFPQKPHFCPQRTGAAGLKRAC